MLMRSASTPLLNSLIQEPESSSTVNVIQRIPRNRSVSLLTTCFCSCSSPASSDGGGGGGSVKKMTRALSETDLSLIGAVPKRKPANTNVGLHGLDVSSLQEGDEEEMGCESPSSLDGSFLGSLVYGGGDGGAGGGGKSGSWDGSLSNNGNESTDLYYQKMIEADPGNGLVLSNYAKFLKEVQGDLVKAEEYCSRAILANPNDGSVLSMYAEMMWQSHKDAPCAESYFDQAVRAAPDDSYVLASYARFLWDAEEDEEDDNEQVVQEMNDISPLSFFHGVSPTQPPISAAS